MVDRSVCHCHHSVYEKNAIWNAPISARDADKFQSKFPAIYPCNLLSWLVPEHISRCYKWTMCCFYWTPSLLQIHQSCHYVGSCLSVLPTVLMSIPSTPETFDIVSTTVDVSSRKNLAQISKVLTQITGGSEFDDNNPSYVPINDYVRKAIKQMSGWLLEGAQNCSS